MIDHIVMWKFREGTQEQAKVFLDRLAALEKQLPWILSMRIAYSAVEDAQFDVVLTAQFATLEDLHRYQTDPRHVAVSDLCKNIRTQRACIDVQQ